MTRDVRNRPTLSLCCVLLAVWLLCGTAIATYSYAQEPAAQPAAGQDAASPAAKAASSDAVPASDSAVPAQPVEVKVGIYLNRIYDLSLKDNHYTADFYIWFRWRGDEYNPIESFEIVGGHVEIKGDVTKQAHPDGNYAYCRVVATITQFWDVSRFPLDHHTLQIKVEDGDTEEFKLKYVPDVENSGLNPEVQTPGWEIQAPEVFVVSQVYNTNYGDTTLPTNNKSIYSRFLFELALKRSGVGYFLKLFFGLFVATGIAFMAFFIKPTDVDPRFGLGVGAIFAAVASEYVVTSSLPDTNVVTMADVLHILAFIFIFLSIAESTYSLKLYSSEDDAKIARSKALDWWSFVLLGIAFVTLSLLAVLCSWGLRL